VHLKTTSDTLLTKSEKSKLSELPVFWHLTTAFHEVA